MFNAWIKQFFLSAIVCFLCSSVYAITPAKSDHYDTIIVGAGMSGLAAATDLNQHHYKILVLEARNRIGGRIWSVNRWNKTIDLGASWIHGMNNNPIAKIVESLSIKTIPTSYQSDTPTGKINDSDIFDPSGKKIPTNEVDDMLPSFTQFATFAQHFSTEKNVTIADALTQYTKQHQLSERQSLILNYMVTTSLVYELADDLNNISAHAEEFHKGSQVSGTNVIFPEGYKQVITHLAKNIPILLNHKVINIRQDKSGVEVDTEHDKYFAKNVIVTLPLGVLKANSVKFYPPLPAYKERAIAEGRMGVLDKTYLLFPKVFWNNRKEWIEILPKKASNAPLLDILNYGKFTHKPLLLVFTAGSQAKAFEKMSNENIIKNMMLEIRNVYGKNTPNPTAYVITRWYQDPYAHGSYSYLSSTTPFSFYERMAKPVNDRLFFAGEATSETDPSTVHGAYLSGVRAAHQVEQLISHDPAV